MREARELEPLSPLINVYSAGALYFGRQYDQAVERCRSTLEIEPDFALAHLVLGWVYREQGRHEDAVAALERAVELSPGSLDHRAWLGHALAVAGDTDGAGTILEELDDLAEERYVSAGHRALVLAGLDRREEALDGLETAFEERFPWLVFLRVEPAFDDLRDEERFQTLLEKMGL